MSTLTQILESNDAVVVDFYADWCGPCKKIAPFFEELKNSNPDIAFVKFNVDDHESLSEEYSVTAMPTFISFYKGNIYSTITGADKSKLQTVVSKLSEKLKK